MTSRKKYTHLLFVLSISLHSLPIMSAEFLYGDIPVQEVTETTKSFSKIAFENPVLVITPLTACLLGGVMFKNRHRLPTAQLVAQRINRVHGEIELRVIDNLLKFQNACGEGMDSCIDTMPLPGFAREGAKSSLRSVVNGIINLLPFNKKFLTVSFCFWGAGGIIPFSNVFAGLTLLAGFTNGIRQDLKNHFDAKLDQSTASINAKIDESKKALLEEITGVSKEIQNVQLSLGNLTLTVNKGFFNAKKDTKKVMATVRAQSRVVANNVMRNVTTYMDQRLVELFTQINRLTERCVNLSNSVSRVEQGNAEVAQAMKRLEGNLLKMREDFSAVLEESLGKMDASTKKSIEMIEKMGAIGQAQDAKIASLITEVTNNNLLLNSLRKIQSESGQALKTLEQNRATDSAFLNELFTRQEKSDSSFVKQMSSLHEQNKKFQASLNTSLDILSQRLNTLEQNQATMKGLVIQTDLEVKLMANNQEQQFQAIQVLFQEQAHENKNLHKEIFQLRDLIQVQANTINNLEGLLKKLDDRLQGVEKQTACLPAMEKNIKETKENTEEHKNILGKILHHVSSPHPILTQEQASIQSGLAVSIDNPSFPPSFPLDFGRPKAFKKPTPGFFPMLKYDHTSS